MSTIQVDAQIYERAGFSQEHARQLANLLSVVRAINDRLVREGKPSLLDQLREKRKAQAIQNGLSAFSDGNTSAF